jgi:hypothetical protein
MPSGNVTLLEAAKCGDDQVKAGVVETIIQESPIIESLPWLTIEGTALKQTVEETLPDVQFRNVNEGYTKSWGSDSERFWGVTILGGEVSIDPFLLGTVANKVNLQAKQWAKFAKSNAMRFDWQAINGVPGSKGFYGWKYLIDEGLGQKFANSTTGATISLDKLDEAHDLFRNQGGADAALLNRTTRRQITKAARTSVTGVSLIDVGSDVFGRQVVTWNDIPLRILGDVRNSSNATVPALAFDEDPGDAVSDTCSLYFVKFGEDDVCGLYGNGGSMQFRSFGETEAAPQILGRMEWYPGMAVFNKYSLVRLYGITAS